jgi:7-carboxy-7-deazaguanine synthase (Cx14CxxC type)
MTYSVKEIFYSLQGEGHHSGRPAIFCRFAGCNLWNGKESSRASSVCTFCDTDFTGTDGQNGGKFPTEETLAEAIENLWPADKGNRFIVFTGGEPGLQLTSALICTLQKRGFECAVESNGTVPLPSELDWVCISPKGASDIVIRQCDELKLVYPQPNALPERFALIKASYRYLSPLNDWTESTLIAGANKNTQQCIEFCLQNPQWRLTLQSHKILNID